MLDFWTRHNLVGLETYRLSDLPGRAIVFLSTESACTYTGCGWDEQSQSAKLIGCPVCHGFGKVITWNSQTLRARVCWSAAELVYLAPGTGVELGDVTLGIVPADLDRIEQVIESERSYILVDGKTVRPTNTSPSVLPGVGNAFLVTCKLFHVEQQQ